VSVRSRLNALYVNRREVRKSRRLSGFSSYSQFGEDAIVNSLVGDGQGVYLDIGAGHPVTYSNTYAFYRRGWSGVLVEPLPSNVAHAKRVRPRDTAVSALCGDEARGVVDLYEYSQYEYSTMEPDRVAELAEQGFEPVARHRLPILGVDALVTAHQLTDIDVFSLDVEGAEMSVLTSANWNRFRPHVAVIEEWNSPIQQQTPVSEFMQGHGYELSAVTGFSSIYVAV